MDPEPGQGHFIGATSENGQFQFPSVENDITLKYNQEDQDGEFTLEEYVKEINTADADSLYALYSKGAEAGERRLYKKLLSPSQYADYLEPPASSRDTSLREVEPVLTPE